MTLETALLLDKIREFRRANTARIPNNPVLPEELRAEIVAALRDPAVWSEPIRDALRWRFNTHGAGEYFLDVHCFLCSNARALDKSVTIYWDEGCPESHAEDCILAVPEGERRR